MTAWMTANPIAALFLAVLALLGAIWLVREVWTRLRGTVQDHSEREPEQDGDVTIRIFQLGRRRPYPGDGVDAGV